MIISTSFYDINEMILTEKVIFKISVDSNFKFVRQSYAYSGGHWGSRGQSASLTAKNLSKIGEIRKRGEKIGKKRKNWEEKAKVFYFAPLQIGLDSGHATVCMIVRIGIADHRLLC